MIKEHDSEWASVSDLMASTIAVLVIFLVALIMLSQPQEPSAAQIAQEKIRGEINNILKDFKSAANGDPQTSLFAIDTATQSITLQYSAFESGYPCLKDPASDTIRENSSRIKKLLLDHPQLVITIEGYADTSTFHDGRRTRCYSKYPYNDNVTLSLARAEETRDVLIGDWYDTTLTERVAALGYGATKQLAGKSMDDNRRVVFRVEFRNDTTRIIDTEKKKM